MIGKHPTGIEYHADEWERTQHCKDTEYRQRRDVQNQQRSTKVGKLRVTNYDGVSATEAGWLIF